MTRFTLVLFLAACASPDHPFIRTPSASRSVGAVPHGKLFCGTDKTTPQEGIVLSGRSNVPVAAFVCQAVDEEIAIEQIAFINYLTEEHAWGDDEVAASVTLMVDGYGMHTAQLVNHAVSFGGLGIIVPTNRSLSMVLAIDTALIPIDADSGDRIQLNIDPNIAPVTAYGMDSGVPIELNDRAVADSHVLRFTKPSLFLGDSSPPDDEVYQGMQKVLEIDAATDSSGNVPIQSFVFRIKTTDSGATGWNTCAELADPAKWGMFDLTGRSVVTSWEFFDGKGDECAWYPNHTITYARPSVQMVIPAGDTDTFSVWVDSSGASSGDTLILGIPPAGLPQTLSPITWDDDIYAFDVDGEYVEHLPIIGGKLTFN